VRLDQRQTLPSLPRRHAISSFPPPPPRCLATPRFFQILALPSLSSSHITLSSLPTFSALGLPRTEVDLIASDLVFFLFETLPLPGHVCAVAPHDEHLTTASPKAASRHPLFPNPQSPSPLPLSYLADLLPCQTPSCPLFQYFTPVPWVSVLAAYFCTFLLSPHSLELLSDFPSVLVVRLTYTHLPHPLIAPFLLCLGSPQN
jgi:hypothetical protein